MDNRVSADSQAGSVGIIGEEASEGAVLGGIFVDQALLSAVGI